MIRLYLITPDGVDPASRVLDALEALPRGVAAVQLRQSVPARELLKRARALRPICTEFGAPLLINDRIDVALAADADGVHLPAHGVPVGEARRLLGPGKLVAASTHARGEGQGADLIVFGPVFETPGKAPPRGIEELRAVARDPVPVYALGGVDASNAWRCLDVGARGVACIRAVLGAGDVAAAALALWKAVALALVLCAAAARADDVHYQDYPVGSRALALGGAFVALSDDPSGLYYNPAGICDSRRLNVSVSASLYGIERQAAGAIEIDRGTFSLATLNSLNVIPGEAGLIRGHGSLDARGTPFAFGFDVTVPSFRSYGIDATQPFQVHTRVSDRTFDLAAGAGMRWNEKLNLGLALHYVLRLYDTSEDALSVQGATDPGIGVYHADASFQNGNLVALLGAKYRHTDEWLFGAALGLPGIPLHSAGKVSVQDVTANPDAPAGQRTVATTVSTTEVDSRTRVPALLRLGVARVEARRWTLSGQITGHLGTSYDRFSVAPAISRRLRVQDHIERDPVVDLNLGGEYLLTPEVSVALGLFTDRSAAPRFQVDDAGNLVAGSSRQPRVSMYGGTATVGLIGLHSISRLGVSAAYGAGEDAVPNDPTGIVDPDGFRVAPVHQLFLYVFLASTFRY